MVDPMTATSRGRHTYTTKSQKALTILRVCGAVDLVAGTALLLGGVILPFVLNAGAGEGEAEVVMLLFGPLAVWSGLSMLWGRVHVSADSVSSGNLWFHRWPRNAVVAVDVRRKDFGRLPRTVPYLVLRDGEYCPLFPLARSASRQTAFRASLAARESQQQLVDELRMELGVGGSDCQLPDS